MFRHAEAQRAKVKLVEQDGRVFVCIADNGKGIARHLEELQTGSYGIGIAGIKQRVEELGGQLVFRNTAPGTTVEVTTSRQRVRDASLSSVASRSESRSFWKR